MAKVASVKRVAAVGGVPLNELLNTLRLAVGQEPVSATDEGDVENYFSERPSWFDRARVVCAIDEQADTPSDAMALPTVAKAAENLGGTEILELVTAFLPATGIDILREEGFLVWSVEESPTVIRTSFTKRSA